MVSQVGSTHDAPATRERRVAPALFAALLVAGIGATAVATAQVLQAAEDRDARRAEFVAERLSGVLDRSAAALRGADGFADDSVVTAAEVEGFGRDVLQDSLFTALAFSEIVPGDQLETWSAATGVEARDTDGAGGFVRAAPKSVHYVVRFGHPATTTLGVIGFDLASDPVRSAGVRTALTVDEPVVVGPISLANSADAGLFVVHVVEDATGAQIGFVSSGFVIDDWIGRLGELASSFSLTFDGESITPGREIDGARRSFTVGGASFEVVASDPQATEWLLPGLMAIGTVAIAALAERARRTDRRHRLRRLSSLERQSMIVTLGQGLAGAADSDDVLAMCATQAGSIVGAQRVSVARVDPGDWSRLRVHDGAAPGPVRFVGIDDAVPLARCARSARDLAAAGETSDAPGFEDGDTVMCAPLLQLGRGARPPRVLGAIEFAWDAPVDRFMAAEYAPAVQTIAAFAARALDRALLGEATRDRAMQLSRFAQALAVAESEDDIGRAVERWVPAITDADRASVASTPDARDSRGTRLHVAVEWSGRTDPPTPTVAVVMHTVEQLVEAAGERAERHRHEHDLVQRLQRATLEQAPHVEGIDFALRYVPAVSALGVGGDWYDVLSTGPSETFVVVGDVAGHGPEAVTVMSEVKAIVRHLLLARVDLADVLVHVDICLQRHATFASLVLLRLDTAEGTVTLVNAGHPYPIRCTAGGPELLKGGHGPLAGVAALHPVRVAAAAPFSPGDSLVLYTDGLVERRNLSIDQAIDALAGTCSARSGLGIDEWADGLISDRLDALDALQLPESDDDIVVVIARRAIDAPGGSPTTARP
jgi:Stage II sporulation protein E (SpoIIE)/CHASE domain